VAQHVLHGKAGSELLRRGPLELEGFAIVTPIVVRAQIHAVLIVCVDTIALLDEYQDSVEQFRYPRSADALPRIYREYRRAHARGGLHTPTEMEGMSLGLD